MKIILHDQDKYVIRLDTGEDLFGELRKFCEAENVNVAQLNIIGSSKKIVLAYYNLETRSYEDHVLDEELEVTGIIGNITKNNGEIAIHIHGTVSSADLKTYGGHIKELVVGLTLEVFLTTIIGSASRSFDEVTGLNLLT